MGHRFMDLTVHSDDTVSGALVHAVDRDYPQADGEGPHVLSRGVRRRGRWGKNELVGKSYHSTGIKPAEFGDLSWRCCAGGRGSAAGGRNCSTSPFPAVRVSLLAVRLTEFWTRMQEQFGAAYAESIASDQVLGELGGRSVREALAAGEDPKLVWRAVCSAFDVPARNR